MSVKNWRAPATACALLAAAAMTMTGLTPALAAETTPTDTSQSGTVEVSTDAEAPQSGLAQAAPTNAQTPVAQANEDVDPNTLTVLSTTDTHGHIYDWDYYTAQVPQPKKGVGQDVGLARLSTAIQQIRADRGAGSVLLYDSGDTIQGTPLTYLAAMQPDKLETASGSDVHPMAQAFNDLGYNAGSLGNHEFNYGLDTLRAYEKDLDMPLLGANVIDDATGQPAFTPYVINHATVAGHDVKVGVLGLVTPGVRIWDKANVSGKLLFEDPTEVALKYVPEMKANGADIVIIATHTGHGDAQDWEPSELQENTAQFLTTKVDDVDIVLGGHTHQDVPGTVTHSPDGSPVLYTQSWMWAQVLSDIKIPLTFSSDDADATVGIDWPTKADGSSDDAAIANWVSKDYARDLTDDALLTDDPILQADHGATLDYVNTKVATATEDMSGADSRWKDTPIMDFVGKVMTDVVSADIADGKGLTDAFRPSDANLPVVAQVSPFSRDAFFPKGDVTIKDMAGLYIYENTLMASRITGAQMKDYLEFSAMYFCRTEVGATFDPETCTGAPRPSLTRGADPTQGIPDYNYDALTGVDYLIDVSQPVGSRIENLTYEGKPVADDDQFILAINNYRQSGGGDYVSYVGDMPLVYDAQKEIRQEMIEYAQDKGVIDPADFFVDNWRITTAPYVAPTPEPSDTPTDQPTTPAPSTSGSASPAGGLASTGTDAGVLAVLAVLVAAIGASVTVSVRRRS
ncbi:MAG: 5'-nucleotidase C-terminal domain-containing protein [Actinomyces sp.]|nr:5'-nucleotidase C-terminal domain-containing protein [Actinomyces sp.]MCI1641879.1 5'-nucleotidase C-terminal domain-containing protein [Actinomyces sp.]MCI1662059.1 5'-nucleotidase C-terminal domain-containing protein [Actinomyces sp.]MCI1690741.1 5'-nucleotidase C-terminal domain-containing protein [Actinomyces sp.]